MRLYIILFLLSGFLKLKAQETLTQKITGSYHESPLTKIVEDIETQTGLRFYFDPANLDTLSATLAFRNENLEAVLANVFTPYDLYCTIVGKKIFISKGKKLVADLPDKLFNTGQSSISTTSTPLTVDELSVVKKQPVAVLENKVYEIGDPNAGNKTALARLDGYVLDSKTGEAIPGVSIMIDKLKLGVATDQFGYYSLSVPKGNHILNIQSLGKKDTRRQIQLHSDGKMDIELSEQIIALKEVIISASKASNISNVQMGVERLNIKAIRQVPTAFGEVDILRVVLTLPGVKTVGEATTGFNVRGGATDQNLILYNGATIYNPAHFFGFFSAFNPDVIKDIELYKSSIPSKFGGRLSSVLEINSREGNKREFSGSAGIGLLTSRISLEGPIKKDKTSFILGGRTTYANWLIGLLPDEYNDSRGSFADVDLHISHEIDKKNNLYFNGYYSRDKFSLNSDTAYGYSNANFSVKWKHNFSNKLNSVFSAGFDQYKYNIESTGNKVNAYTLQFDISQYNLKGDFNYYLNSDHTIDFGFSSIRYRLNPGSYTPASSTSLIEEDIVPSEHALETAFYIGDRYSVTPELSLNLGLRYSLYNYLGPQEVWDYAAGLPRVENNRLNKNAYESGDFITNYSGPEYRVSARYSLNEKSSLKAAYNTSRQYIHMLSNTTAIAPTDIWKLSDPHIKPQRGEQFSLGYYRNFKSNTIETSIEVYYKNIKDYLDYKSGATLVLNHDIETDVINTRGRAYGVELMVKKQTGKLNGWISYTYSRTLLKMDDPIAGELINRGEYYPSNYDKPHDITLIGNYRFSHRFSLSFNSTYSTGRPITLPVGRYYYAGSERVIYSDRNAYRIPDYFRTDISINIEGNHKVHQKTHNSWTFGVYNLTGRKNPYSVYFVSENSVINGYRLSIFGSVIPFVNFNIRF